MGKRQIDRFFNILNREIEGWAKGNVKIILTGAMAGILMGGNRPSLDIDFAITSSKRYFEKLEEAIRKVSEVTGIAANFSEDIDRWSQIAFLDYKNHTLPYKKFGIIDVTILSPEYWTIGKITRYIDPDIDDLVKVLKKNRISPLKLARLWRKALIKSPRSNAVFLFKRQAEHFLRTYGPSIWGANYNLYECVAILKNTRRDKEITKSLNDISNGRIVPFKKVVGRKQR